MPTSQMTIHGICLYYIILNGNIKCINLKFAIFIGTNNNTQMMAMPEQTKNDQLRVYNGRLYVSSDLSNNILGAQEMCPAFPQNTYEQQPTPQPDQIPGNLYGGKSPRVQYVNTQNKIITQQDSGYPKYNSGKYIRESENLHVMNFVS